jgi:hypothetical protein
MFLWPKKDCNERVSARRCQGVAGRMAQHVQMALAPKLGRSARALHHAAEASPGERRATLRGEHERRFWLLFALEPPQRA